MGVLEVAMACKECGSIRQTALRGRLCLQLPAGPSRLSRPPILVSSSVLVCLECGAVESKLPRAKLRLLQVDARTLAA